MCAAALLLGVLGSACTPARGAAKDARDASARDASAQGVALRELFVTREHARQLVLWTDTNERGPTFDVLGENDAASAPAALAAATATPVVAVGSPDLVRLFRAHPDGWAAFYAAYPGAPGLVELARPVWSGDTLATVVVGRACGEHCLYAWRVTVRDGRVVATAPIRLPKL